MSLACRLSLWLRISRRAIELGKLTDPHSAIGELGDDDQLATHRFDEATQGAQVHIGATRSSAFRRARPWCARPRELASRRTSFALPGPETSCPSEQPLAV